MCFGDVSNLKSIETVGFREPIDVVVSCLASRTGGKVRPCCGVSLQLYNSAFHQ